MGSGRGYDHFPIFFDLQNGPHKPPGPLNFNKGWLKDESFTNLVLSLWAPFNPRRPLYATFQFGENIKGLKGPIKEWAHAKRIRDDFELVQVEADLCRICEEARGGLRTQESKDFLVGLEGRRITLLLKKE